jgi:phospho-N-acetylmuramoyl-pentapeptide-transferase
VVVALGVGLSLMTLANHEPPLYNTRLIFPFFKRWIPDLGWAYVPFAMLVLVCTTNAVNFTDGLDGLAASTFSVSAATYTALAYVTGHAVLANYLQLVHFPTAELTVFCGTLVGASLGFLWWNAHPADIFMGDVGSLALGGALGTVAILIKQELLLPIVGGVFVMEGASVVIQVASYRLRGGKRVFRMAPLHHHFELIGWAEPKIITRFLILAIIFGLFSLTTLKLR